MKTKFQAGLHSFTPATNKILVGSSSKCDWIINDSSVSDIHALLVFAGDSWNVIDLASSNGIFILGDRIDRARLKSGDEITLGNFSFSIETEIPAVADVFNEEVIESNWIPDQTQISGIHPSLLNLKSDAESLDDFDESFELSQTQKDFKIEVMVFTSGSLISVDYLEWPTQKIILSSKLTKDSIFFPGLTENLSIDIDSSRKSVMSATGFEKFSPFELTSTESHFLTQGMHQISLRLVEQSYSVRPFAWWTRDKDFLKKASKTSAALFLPFLLLLLVTMPEVKKEEEQVTIVYKELPKEKEPEKVEESDKVQKEQLQKVVKADVVVKDNRKIVEAKAGNPSPNPTPAPVVKKTFSFKSTADSAAASVVDGTVAIDNRKSGAGNPSLVSGATANTDSLNAASGGGKGVGAGQGFDIEGRGTASIGARGLVAKKGFANSYIAPKTVILGSMDPELLRKILQEYIPQFQHCYQQELARAGDVKGVIDLNFTIGADGRVSASDIKAKDARFSGKGIGCMDNVLRIIAFPSPKGGGRVDVKQPLNFFAETEKI